jgi:hypothetical protein
MHTLDFGKRYEITILKAMTSLVKTCNKPLGILLME